MSLRPPVSRDRIEVFLRRLAQDYRQPARLYLVGGTSLVFERLRQQTLDVDITIEVSADHHGELIQVLRKIKDTLGINIEEVSPADFIPLPAGFENRHEFIGRFGQVDVFHFDWYSTALSKIERGRQQDLADVVAALKNKRLVWSKLESMFREILPLVGEKSLKQDPQDFVLNFGALAALWHSAGGTL
jgi:hypothetical protein